MFTFPVREWESKSHYPFYYIPPLISDSFLYLVERVLVLNMHEKKPMATGRYTTNNQSINYMVFSPYMYNYKVHNITNTSLHPNKL